MDEDQITEQMDANGAGSLAARARTRRDHLLERKTTTIEVPGYDGILSVEYRAITYSEGRRIAGRHERQSDDAIRELYIACDQLMTASVNAYELSDEAEPRSLNTGWGVPLAQMLGIEVFDTMTPRQAMIACFARDVFITRHWAEYTEWLSGAQIEADEEQRQDFGARS